MTYLLIFAVGLSSLLVGVRLGWQLCCAFVRQQILDGALDHIILDAAKAMTERKGKL